MNNLFSYIRAVRVVSATVSSLFFACCVLAQGETPTNPPPGFASRVDYLKSLTNEAVISDAYKKGFINKDEASQATSNRLEKLHFTDESSLRKAYDLGVIGKGEAMLLQSQMRNKQAQNLYGKVVDQNGQPVAGVDVMGEVEIMNGFIVGKIEKYKTQTDAGGLFQLVGLKGASLSARVSKSGYEINDYRVGRIAPAGGQSSSNDRVTFIMCKLHGGEPMKRTQIDSDVPCDGSIKRFNLLSSIQKNTGDLLVGLTRNPLTLTQGNRYKPFDWSVTLAITNGGLQELTNIYPNDAPADGYQSAINLNFPSNMTGWQYKCKRNYYFKSQDGQVYGRMVIDVDASRPQPTTYFSAEVYANPAGSRNLEFDPSKQIRQ